MQQLGNITQSDFLKQYWQKKPLLVRQAFPNYKSPISPEELAGLACEEGIESRLIQENGPDRPWQVQYGPFKENDFTSLPKSHWSLLVQAADHHIPELSQLLDEFNFIPNWRIDDLMISYAPIHGSVGPHLDNYDVFLLQVKGRRHWHINEHAYTEDDFDNDLELRILNSFNAEEDWVLKPGDMLYLPPGVAHHGIALDDCLTYSIGFRAPSQKELLSAFTVNFNDVAKDKFYTDPKLKTQEFSGEIKKEDIESLHEMVLSTCSNKADFASWFGRFITDNRDDYEQEEAIVNEPEFYTSLKEAKHISRYGNVRMSYIDDGNTIKLFYAGNESSLPKSQLPLIQYLCSKHRLECAVLLKFDDEHHSLSLLYKLHKEGCLTFDE
ncbi:MAG: cupin [Thermodesulfobacteriota bacterium]|nr:MAG: cupin [Thermodesulfobacteriota bacterium]